MAELCERYGQAGSGGRDRRLVGAELAQAGAPRASLVAARACLSLLAVGMAGDQQMAELARDFKMLGTYVCARCVDDPYIKAYINDGVVEKACDVLRALERGRHRCRRRRRDRLCARGPRRRVGPARR